MRMEDRTLGRRRTRTRRMRVTRRGRRGMRWGRRGMRTVRGCMMRGWGGVTGLLQDPHPHAELGLATSFALL
jgi:hypothetical protein